MVAGAHCVPYIESLGISVVLIRSRRVRPSVRPSAADVETTLLLSTTCLPAPFKRNPILLMEELYLNRTFMQAHKSGHCLVSISLPLPIF